MKNVIFAAVLFVLLISLSLFSGAAIIKETESLLIITVSIPEDVAGMENRAEQSAQAAEQLSLRWNRAFPYLTYVTGYTSLNRADDAVTELCSAIRTGSYAEAVTARAKLLDALYRMRALEKISLSSVF